MHGFGGSRREPETVRQRASVEPGAQPIKDFVQDMRGAGKQRRVRTATQRPAASFAERGQLQKDRFRRRIERQHAAFSKLLGNWRMSGYMTRTPRLLRKAWNAGGTRGHIQCAKNLLEIRAQEDLRLASETAGMF